MQAAASFTMYLRCDDLTLKGKALADFIEPIASEYMTRHKITCQIPGATCRVTTTRVKKAGKPTAFVRFSLLYVLDVAAEGC